MSGVINVYSVSQSVQMVASFLHHVLVIAFLVTTNRTSIGHWSSSLYFLLSDYLNIAEHRTLVIHNLISPLNPPKHHV